MTEILVSPSSGALSETEAQAKAECEARIKRGLKTFVEIGSALLEIRTRRLYRDTHDTFDDYCRQRWDLRREIADRLVRAAEVVAIINPIGLPEPKSESVARELAPLRDEPRLLCETWAEVVEEHGPEPTAAQVREVVAEQRGHKLAPLMSSASAEWETPQELFDVLDAEFDFELDVCASPGMEKCDEYFSPEVDGLAQNWTGTCWMNPPYGDEIKHWVKKAHDSALDGATVVCLVPARVDTGWWWDYCRYGEVRFLRGRLKFGGAETGAPFPSAVVIFGSRPNTLSAHWEWR